MRPSNSSFGFLDTRTLRAYCERQWGRNDFKFRRTDVTDPDADERFGTGSSIPRNTDEFVLRVVHVEASDPDVGLYEERVIEVARVALHIVDGDVMRIGLMDKAGKHVVRWDFWGIAR
jgi:hypothetical protein